MPSRICSPEFAFCSDELLSRTLCSEFGFQSVRGGVSHRWSRTALFSRSFPELDFRPLGRESEWKLNDQVFHWKAQNELFWLPPRPNPFVSYAEEYPARRR